MYTYTYRGPGQYSVIGYLHVLFCTLSSEHRVHTVDPPLPRQYKVRSLWILHIWTATDCEVREKIGDIEMTISSGQSPLIGGCIEVYLGSNDINPSQCNTPVPVNDI